MSPRHTILIALATVTIFAAGVVTGGLLVHKTGARQPNANAPGAGVPFLGRVESLSRAAGQLELSPDQRQRITEHARNAREQISDYFLILEPDIQQVFRDLRQKISSELTPQQRGEFDELLRKRMQRSAERRPANSAGGGSPHPSGPAANPPQP